MTKDTEKYKIIRSEGILCSTVIHPKIRSPITHKQYDFEELFKKRMEKERRAVDNT